MPPSTSSGTSVTWVDGRLQVDAPLKRTAVWVALVVLTTSGVVPGITSLVVLDRGTSGGSNETDADQTAEGRASSSTRETTCTGATGGP